MNLSKGNRKMMEGFLIWNLPAQKSCPMATNLCKKYCYAKKAERIYPNCLPSRNANLLASRKEGFSSSMIALIAKTIKGYKRFGGFFRIHESGDFYNQKYLDAWKEIARAFPNVRFLAFTKSFNLDFQNAPENLQIVFSIMPDTKALPSGKPLAYAGNCPNMTNCIECPGNCDTCGLCWNLSAIGKNVHFNLH